MRLGCRVCDEYFAFDVRKQREEWNEHVKFAHRGVGAGGGGRPAGDGGAGGPRAHSAGSAGRRSVGGGRSSYPRRWKRDGDSSRWVLAKNKH